MAHWTIKGPDNPTSQLLPKMSFNGFSRDGEGKTKEVVKDREGKTVGMYVCMYGTRPQRNGHCSNTKRYKTWKEVNVDTGMRHTRRLFLVASRPMLIPLEHRHLVTFLQCQWAWFFAHCAKPLRQTNVKACQLQLSRNKSRRVCGRFQLVNYEDSRGLP